MNLSRKRIFAISDEAKGSKGKVEISREILIELCRLAGLGFETGFACYVDGGVVRDCVFDVNEIDSCECAERLCKKGKGKVNCRHWKRIKEEDKEKLSQW
jgi:hypothetical protein